MSWSYRLVGRVGAGRQLQAAYVSRKPASFLFLAIDLEEAVEKLPTDGEMKGGSEDRMGRIISCDDKREKKEPQASIKRLFNG